MISHLSDELVLISLTYYSLNVKTITIIIKYTISMIPIYSLPDSNNYRPQPFFCVLPTNLTSFFSVGLQTAELLPKSRSVQFFVTKSMLHNELVALEWYIHVITTPYTNKHIRFICTHFDGIINLLFLQL